MTCVYGKMLVSFAFVRRYYDGGRAGFGVKSVHDFIMKVEETCCHIDICAIFFTFAETII